MPDYDPTKNAIESYDLAIAEKQKDLLTTMKKQRDDLLEVLCEYAVLGAGTCSISVEHLSKAVIAIEQVTKPSPKKGKFCE